ncbi:MAG: hypothetical protein ACI8X5_001421 [Planctomycetota bacterium]|jgi:hypothetical protein
MTWLHARCDYELAESNRVTPTRSWEVRLRGLVLGTVLGFVPCAVLLNFELIAILTISSRIFKSKRAAVIDARLSRWLRALGLVSSSLFESIPLFPRFDTWYASAPHASIVLLHTRDPLGLLDPKRSKRGR